MLMTDWAKPSHVTDTQENNVGHATHAAASYTQTRQWVTLSFAETKV